MTSSESDGGWGANGWVFAMYKFLKFNHVQVFYSQVKRLTFFRLTTWVMIKQWCYKMPFRAFLTHHLSACLEMYPYVLLNKYLMRLVSYFESSGTLVGLFFITLDTVSTYSWISQPEVEYSESITLDSLILTKIC